MKFKATCDWDGMKYGREYETVGRAFWHNGEGWRRIKDVKTLTIIEVPDVFIAIKYRKIPASNPNVKPVIGVVAVKGAKGIAR
jgi:hypothetical protein